LPKAPKSKVKVAMVGAGSMANAVHYPSLAEMKDVDIVGIADLNEQRLNDTADKYGVKGRFTDYRKMVEQTKPDAVYVIMPPHQLFDIVMDVMEMGCHCCIEKPPGIYAEQTRQMAKFAAKRGLITMTLFNRRFIPGLVQAKKAVEKEGPVLLCVSAFYKNHFGAGPYYRGATDILSCDAVHAVDTLRWMAGSEAKAVTSCVDSWYMDFDNAFNAIIRFDSGAVGVLLTNWASGKRVHRFEIHGKGICAFVDWDTTLEIYHANQVVKSVSLPEAAKSDKPHHVHGFFGENRHFIDCVKKGKQPICNFADSAKTMELVQRIYGSAIG
jgi:virulence factor